MRIRISKYEVPKTEVIISLMTALGVFAKQFYLSASGSLQIGDVFLISAALLTMLCRGIHLKKRDGALAAFILLSVFVNVVYYVFMGDTRFVLSILYMIFNGVVVIFLFRPFIESDFFLKTIMKTCKLVLLCQAFLFAIGRGVWMYSGTRYIGTFNDPNQYGFYVLSCFFCIYLISKVFKEKVGFFWMALTAAEILISASSGMILTYLIFNVGFIVGLNTASDEKTNKKEIYSIVVLSLAVLLLSVFYRQILDAVYGLNIFGLNRIISRLNNMETASEGFGLEFLRNRGLRRIIEEPYYFLFGSGEGGWLRFKTDLNEGYELHSTIIGLAFYYGIIPFAFWIKWVKSNVSRMIKSIRFVYIALFIEALTLINHRQPIFWFIIILASHKALKTDSLKKQESLAETATQGGQ